MGRGPSGVDCLMPEARTTHRGERRFGDVARDVTSRLKPKRVYQRDVSGNVRMRPDGGTDADQL